MTLLLSLVALQLALPAQPAKLDSLAAIQSAIAAQRIFERVRLTNMPYGPSASREGRCDEYIGRFCYSFGDRSAVPDDEPVEADEVRRAREKLIAKLDTLLTGSEVSDWLLGTLIRYQIEANEGAAALRSLAYCTATSWWCSALRGYVAHRMDRHVDAERAFDEARSLMAADVRCAWDDIAHLLEPDARKAYKALPCDERLRITRNAWWLARPLFSRPGNDRRSEHDSRKVLLRLGETGINPTWLKWAPDMAELLTRFGWPKYWRRYWVSMADPALPNPQVSQYHAEPSYHFLPELSAMRDPAHADAFDWDLLPPDSREEYSPSGLIFGKMEQQSARFLRGDSVLLVSRVSLAPDSLLGAAGSFTAGIAMAASPEEAPALHFERRASQPFLLQTRTRNRNWVASIEVKTDSNRAARARFGAPAITLDAAGHAISDMLLFNTGPEEPRNLAAAMAAMRSSPSIERTSPVGIYWELYGLSRDDKVDVELSAQPEERGFLRRIGEALRLVSKERAARLQWPETATDDNAVVPRSIALNHSALRPGWYTLRLSVVVNSAPALVASRRIEIVR